MRALRHVSALLALAGVAAGMSTAAQADSFSFGFSFSDGPSCGPIWWGGSSVVTTYSYSSWSSDCWPRPYYG